MTGKNRGGGEAKPRLEKCQALSDDWSMSMEKNDDPRWNDESRTSGSGAVRREGTVTPDGVLLRHVSTLHE
jgi:hypothetical protein